MHEVAHPKYGWIRKPGGTVTNCPCCGQYFPTLKEAADRYHRENIADIEFDSIYSDLKLFLLNSDHFQYDAYKIAFEGKQYGIHRSNNFFIQDGEADLPRLYDMHLGFRSTRDVSFSITIGETVFNVESKAGQFTPFIDGKFPLVTIAIPYMKVVISPPNVVECLEVIGCSLWQGRLRLARTCTIYNDDSGCYVSSGGIWLGKKESIPREQYITSIPPIPPC